MDATGFGLDMDMERVSLEGKFLAGPRRLGLVCNGMKLLRLVSVS